MFQMIHTALPSCVSWWGRVDGKDWAPCTSEDPLSMAGSNRWKNELESRLRSGLFKVTVVPKAHSKDMLERNVSTERSNSCKRPASLASWRDGSPKDTWLGSYDAAAQPRHAAAACWPPDSGAAACIRRLYYRRYYVRRHWSWTTFCEAVRQPCNGTSHPQTWRDGSSAVPNMISKPKRDLLCTRTRFL
jgi:hypothetical protein